MAISCHFSEANLDSYNANPSSDQLKACSDLISSPVLSVEAVKFLQRNVVASSGYPL